MVLQKFSSRVVATQELCAELLVIHCLLPVAVVGSALKDRLGRTFQTSIPKTPFKAFCPILLCRQPHSHIAIAPDMTSGE